MRPDRKDPQTWTETMDIWTVLKACVRRWYVFLPILGVALWVGNARVEAMPPVYWAESSAALTGPALVPGDEAGEIIEVNPFQSLGGSLNTTTQILVSVMDSGPKRDQFFEQGITLDYQVSQDNAVIYFYVEGDDPAVVTETSSRLVELLDVEIATLQTKPVEAPESRIRAVPLTLPLTAVRDTGAGLQLLAVIGVLGLLLGAGAAIALDGFLRYRARTSERRSADAVSATAWVEPPIRHATRPAARPEIGPGDGTEEDALASGEDRADGPSRRPSRRPEAADAVATQQLALRDPVDDLGDADGSAPVPAPAGRHGRPD